MEAEAGQYEILGPGSVVQSSSYGLGTAEPIPAIVSTAGWKFKCRIVGWNVQLMSSLLQCQIKSRPDQHPMGIANRNPVHIVVKTTTVLFGASGLSKLGSEITNIC